MEDENKKITMASELPSVTKLSSEMDKPKFYENTTFLFVLMGVLTMSSMIGTYFIAQKYDDPMIVIGSVSLVASITTLIGGIAIKTVDQLVATNRMKTDFVSIASHQLRTPLSIIKWYVELLSKEERQEHFTEEDIKYIKIVADSNNRMVRLVNDLLDISRVESGKIKIHPENINMVKMTQDIIKEQKPLAEKRQIKITFKSEPEIPQIMVDPKRISMVIENLVSNAIKYTPEGQDKTISVELSTEKGNEFLFAIADDGVGIPVRDQKKIFKKFFRADNTMKLKTSGTGLGLFIAKAIVESHKGKMWFVSKENEGTTFYFNLPIKSKIKS